VVATASSEEKRRVALELGADEALGYDEFAEAVKADVVLDAVGGDVFKRSIGTLNPLGTIVGIGFADGWWDPLDTALMVGRNLSLFGFYLGRLMKLRPDVVRDAVGELVPLWEAGAIKPLVGATFPLEQAGEAHSLIEARKSVGKVVLVP
jgi:NADPH:quinone reductase